MNNSHHLTAIYPYSIYDRNKTAAFEFGSLLWLNERPVVFSVSVEGAWGFLQNERFRFQACIWHLMEDRERDEITLEKEKERKKKEKKKEKESYTKLV